MQLINNGYQNNKNSCISDVDGVWTDGSFYKGTDNIELKNSQYLMGLELQWPVPQKLELH